MILKRLLILKLLRFYKGLRLQDNLKILALGVCSPILKISPLSKYRHNILNKLARKTIIIVNDTRYVLPDYHSLHIINPHYENSVKALIKRKLKKGMVFIDLGAHIGLYTLLASKLVGSNGLVVALEPHPENFAFLLINLKLNHCYNVIALNYAAYNDDKFVKLYVSSVSGWHSLKVKEGYHITVQARRIDTILNELAIRKVDFMKIDVEGAEYEVLEGAINTLRKYKPRMVIEVRYSNLGKVLSLLRKLRYQVKVLSRGSVSINIYAHPT